MRHSGMGFPNGAVSNASVFALPSPDLLMLSPEGRYHHDAATRAGKLVTWRAIPRIGKRPAELGYNARRFTDEAMNLTDEPSLPIREFIPWNELDLRDERGDGEDDWQGLDARYSVLGQFQLGVLADLRRRLLPARLHFGAWTPDHDALGHIRHWIAAADLADVVDFHAYDTLNNIQRQYQAYRAAFHGKPLGMTEWHCRGDLAEERRVLGWLAATMADDPLFEVAHFFIWRWDGAPDWWSDDWDIEHSAARLALFMDPPVLAAVPAPEVPVPVPSNREKYEPLAREAAARHGVPADLFVRQIGQESGFNPAAHNPSGATGIAQIIPRFHPTVDPTDPVASLEYAAAWMAALRLQHGSWRRALAAYNWGPGRVAAWDGADAGLPAETRRYLDVILGAGWPEPDWTPPKEAPMPGVTVTPGAIGSGLLSMMTEDKTKPAQRASTWLPLGTTPSDVEECYGENGTRYVYLLAVGRGFRFPSDPSRAA